MDELGSGFARQWEGKRHLNRAYGDVFGESGKLGKENKASWRYRFPPEIFAGVCSLVGVRGQCDWLFKSPAYETEKVRCGTSNYVTALIQRMVGGGGNCRAMQKRSG